MTCFLRSKLGKNLRKVAHQFVYSEIDATLRIRQEPPAIQIRLELFEIDYYMVGNDREPIKKFWNFLQGELVNPLIRWTENSLFVIKRRQNKLR